MKSKKLILIYLVIIHFAFLFIIFKTDFIPKVEQKLGFHPEELTPLYNTMVSFHNSMDGNLPDNTTIFIGDSITQGLAVSAVAVPSVNYGIGLDTTYGVLKRISKYDSLNKAKAVVIAIGYNDLRRRSNEEILKNYQKILTLIPKQTPTIISAILPLDERVSGISGNERIREINASLKELSKEFSNTTVVNAADNLLDDTKSNLASKYHVGDGIHLNTQGNEIWIRILKEVIKSL